MTATTVWPVDIAVMTFISPWCPDLCVLAVISFHFYNAEKQTDITDECVTRNKQQVGVVTRKYFNASVLVSNSTLYNLIRQFYDTACRLKSVYSSPLLKVPCSRYSLQTITHLLPNYKFWIKTYQLHTIITRV